MFLFLWVKQHAIKLQVLSPTVILWSQEKIRLFFVWVCFSYYTKSFSSVLEQKSCPVMCWQIAHKIILIYKCSQDPFPLDLFFILFYLFIYLFIYLFLWGTFQVKTCCVFYTFCSHWRQTRPSPKRLHLMHLWFFLKSYISPLKINYLFCILSIYAGLQSVWFWPRVNYFQTFSRDTTP